MSQKEVNVDGGLIISVGGYDIAVFELRLDCPSPDIRVISFAGLECTIEHPTQSHKNVYIKIHKGEGEFQGTVVFRRANMNHVLLFQGLMDFLTVLGRDDSQAVFQLFLDDNGDPLRYTILNAIKIYEAQENEP